MNQPMGRVVALQYRQKSLYTDDGRVMQMDVVRVHIRTHQDEMHYHDLPNGQWAIGNTALRFMALYGLKPSDLDTYTNVEDEQIIVPIAPDPEEGGWGLARAAMQNGAEALENAEWFNENIDTDGDDDGSHGPHGGGSPDPGTGNRAGVEEPSTVAAKMADEDSDATVTME